MRALPTASRPTRRPRIGHTCSRIGHLATLAPLLLAACSDFDLQANPEGNAPVVPDIAVQPVALDFGGHALDQELVRSIRIANAGGVELDVGRILVGPSPAFGIPDPNQSWVIPPGEAVLQEVRYTPMTVGDQSFLVIISDDPDTPELEVPLSGHALVPELSVMPDPLEFGGVTRTCTDELTVDIVNTGLASLTIEEISVSGNGFVTGTDEPLLPVELLPGGFLEWPVSFTPPLDGPEYGGLIRVQSDDPRGPQVGELIGFGEGVPDHTDLFEQVENDWTKIDVAFWVDQSGSMSDDQNNLANNFDTFLDILTAGGIDYNVIGVTRDSGCFNNGIITPRTANPETVFDQAVHGPGGSYNTDSREAGLWGARAAMEASLPGGCNANWRREDVATVVVMVSDEYDQSPGAWRTYVDDVQAVDPEAVLTSVVGQPGSPCAQSAPRYQNAADATGGANLEICAADWGSYFYQIIGVIDPPLSTFVLSEIPDPATIEVEIDGEPSMAWAYDEELNAVVFPAVDLPPPASEISVYYEDVVTCPEGQ